MPESAPNTYTKPTHASMAPASRRDLIAHAVLVTGHTHAMPDGQMPTFVEAVAQAYEQADEALAKLDA